MSRRSINDKATMLQEYAMASALVYLKGIFWLMVVLIPLGVVMNIIMNIGSAARVAAGG